MINKLRTELLESHQVNGYSVYSNCNTVSYALRYVCNFICSVDVVRMLLSILNMYVPIFYFIGIDIVGSSNCVAIHYMYHDYVVKNCTCVCVAI